MKTKPSIGIGQHGCPVPYAEMAGQLYREISSLQSLLLDKVIGK